MPSNDTSLISVAKQNAIHVRHTPRTGLPLYDLNSGSGLLGHVREFVCE